MNPRKLRKDFPALQQEVNGEKLVYLDNAATSQKPRQVIDAVKKFYEKDNANIGRSNHTLGNRATVEYEDARKKVAEFINAGKDELVFTRNTTEAFNLVAQTLQLEGKILVPEMAHHSEQLPWRRKAEREGLEIEYIPVKDHGIDLEALEDMLDEDTALVSLTHVSNVFGVENPVKKAAELAHENDAYIMVDGAQSTPHMNIDVEELDTDFFAFSGHKMLSPTGTGALYARREILEDMQPYQVGGGMVSSVDRGEASWASAPSRFEAGTPNVSGAVGFRAAAEYLEELDLQEVKEHEKKLVNLMHDELEDLEEVEIYSPRDASIFTFRIKQAHPHDTSEILDRNGVAVRGGQHCAEPLMDRLDVKALSRASPYLYNTEGDAEQFVEAVKEVVEVFK